MLTSTLFDPDRYEADRQIGRLLDFLRADSALDQNTLVIFSGDNVSSSAHRILYPVQQKAINLNNPPGC